MSIRELVKVTSKLYEASRSASLDFNKNLNEKNEDLEFSDNGEINTSLNVKVIHFLFVFLQVNVCRLPWESGLIPKAIKLL